MSIPSNKNEGAVGRTASLPKRANGRLRVAAILEAAEAVIAEKGYESATMAEIALRSDTKIGSLYRFFPSKDHLADAIVVHALEGLNTLFDQLDGTAAFLSAADLADGLSELFSKLFSRRALRKLSASDAWSIKNEDLRRTAIARTSQVLRIHTPELSRKSAQVIASTLLSHAKTVAMHQENFQSELRVHRELRAMSRLYLQERISVHRGTK